MQTLFVYGSLKQGFDNEHVNTGRRIEGAYRTRETLPMYLLDAGEVPCIVLDAGAGFQVAGELYAVGEADLARMDRLERIGDADGYERVALELERFDTAPPQRVEAWAYVKRERAIPAATPRIGPLAEYTREHAANFRWRGG